MLQPYHAVLVDELPGNYTVVLTIKFTGKKAILHVGNINSKDIEIDAVGYPSLFYIGYKSLDKSEMTFSIDEVRIEYESKSLDCKVEQ